MQIINILRIIYSTYNNNCNLFYFSYTDNNLNVYKILAKNYEQSVHKGTCSFLNNDVKEVQDYIQKEYNIPVVSNV